MTMMKKVFNALPAFLGGKRRLAPLIFALLARRMPRSSWRGMTFVDPFLGGGSVSLLAKAYGFRVICNDLALRSAAIGRVLWWARSGYFPEPKRSLALVLPIKWILRVQPMSMLRGTDARAAFSGDYDRVSPRRVGHYLRSLELQRPASWWRLAQEVNRGVLPGAGEAYQEDAPTFLAHASGDIVYLDPPYPGTTSYEREYAVLDDLLEGERRDVSGFSRSTDLLAELFRSCRHIPVWRVSLNNAALGLEELEDLIRPYRPNIEAVQVPYRHLGSIATEEKNANNREFIVLASN